MEKFNKDNNMLTLDTYYVEIVPLADWHIGSKECNMDLIKSVISYIKKTPNCYAIGLGDLIDAVTYGSKGSIHEQKILLAEQINNLTDLLKPIKNKILFMLSGNHEDRLIRNSALDIVSVISNNLDIPYYGIHIHFSIKFKDRLCRCYANHNSGGGATAGSKINRLINLHWQSPLSDIILAGHTHDFADTKRRITYIGSRGELCKKIQHFISCGSALESEGGYAAKGAFPPTPVLGKVVCIHMTKELKANNKYLPITVQIKVIYS